VTRSNPEVPFTAGALVSTVPDMTRWARELADGAGLSPATARLRQQWTPLSGTASYGLGVIRFGGWVGHDGSILGYSDMVFHLPSRNATVVVMTNAADGDDVTASPLWIEIVQLLYPGSLPA
jgi:D-alanyl-D-alanine carboxypeptidase